MMWSSPSALNRLSISSGIVSQQFLFKVNYADSRKGYQVEIPDFLTRADWEIVEALQALSKQVGVGRRARRGLSLKLISDK